MNDKLTVIVPVYNVENYIENCLKSIERQDYMPMEVLLVDDGSPDGSSKICEEMALKDDRFCVIHKKNGGLSAARNTGIFVSDSKMITFVDSDDSLIGQPYSYLVDVEKRTDADIVAMKYRIGSEPIKEFDNSQKKSEEEMDSTEFYKRLCSHTVSESAWNKIYKSNVFLQNVFEEGILNEDFLFLIKLTSSKSIRIIQTNYLGYYYLLRQGSITGSGFKRNMADALYNAHFALENIPSKDCELAAEYYLLNKAVMFLINMPKSYIADKNEDYLFAIRCIYKLRKKILSSVGSKKFKILLIMFLHMPRTTKIFADMYMNAKRKYKK